MTTSWNATTNIERNTTNKGVHMKMMTSLHLDHKYISFGIILFVITHTHTQKLAIFSRTKNQKPKIFFYCILCYAPDLHYLSKLSIAVHSVTQSSVFPRSNSGLLCCSTSVVANLSSAGQSWPFSS